MSDTAAEIREYEQQLVDAKATLADDPDNAAKKNVVDEIENFLAVLNETLELEAQEAAQNAAAAPPPKKASPPPPAEPQKWSKEKHPAFQPGFRSAQASESPAPASPAPVVFKVNDTVSAKWKSGDKAFHAGRITSITGSSSAPIYHVKFNDNGATEQVRGGELRHIGQKRKADGSPAVHVPTPPSSAGVITKQPDVNPQLADQARKPEPMMVRDGPPKPQKFQKKAPSNKVLETQKSSWQNFQTKKVGTKKKESMFKTGEGHNARVGFIGSGHEMRKDPKRSRHNYAQDDPDGY